MQARYIPAVDLEVLLDPGSKPWQGVRSEAVKLIGTPLGLQPTPAIMVAWATKKIGAIERVDVSALHDGQTLAFRLEWPDPNDNQTVPDTTAFVDAAAVLLPVVPLSPMATMGAPGIAVNGWYWRADANDRGRQIVAEGIGTSETVDDSLVRGRGAWKGGRWQVVITRALQVQAPRTVAQLKPGQKTGFGVAVWEGEHGERAGLKAYSVDWLELQLEAVPVARS
jgi:DMSO reductase family type II enzyme heme b subunit